MRFTARAIAEQLAVVAIIGLLAWGALLLCRPVRVTGGSMSPALMAGDLVLIDRRDSVSVRDIVLYEAVGHGPVLHRVIAIGTQGALTTKGDANPVIDRDPVPASAVAGPVRAIIPVGKALSWWRARWACDTIAVHTNST